MEPQNDLPCAGSSLQRSEEKYLHGGVRFEVTLQSACPLVWGQKRPRGSGGRTASLSLTSGTRGDSVTWLVPGAFQRVRPEERVAQPGQHVGRGRSQPRRVFTACEPRLPGQRPSVSKVRAEQGRGKLLNQPPVLPVVAGWARSGATCPSASGDVLPPGFSAMELTPWQRQSFCQPRQVWELRSLLGSPAGSGGTPQSLADPLGSCPPGQGGDAGGCSGFGCSQYHREAPASVPASQAGPGRGEAAQGFVPAGRAAAEPASATSLKDPGGNRRLQWGFCHRAGGAPRREAVGKLWTVQLGF